jgi:hypothetical protein
MSLVIILLQWIQSRNGSIFYLGTKKISSPGIFAPSPPKKCHNHIYQACFDLRASGGAWRSIYTSDRLEKVPAAEDKQVYAVFFTEIGDL